MTNEIAKATTPAKAHKSALQWLNKALLAIDDLLKANPDDLEGLVRTQMLLDKMGKDVKLLKDEAERLALEQMGKDKARVVDGYGLVSIKYNSKRVYDDDKVTDFLLQVAAVCADKAERNGDNIERAVVNGITSALYKSAPKQTAVVAYGYDPDKMGHIDWGKRSIEVSPGVTELPSPKPSKTKE